MANDVNRRKHLLPRPHSYNPLVRAAKTPRSVDTRRTTIAELQARQRKPMYMGDWERKLNDFLTLNEREILSHACKISSQLSEDRTWRVREVLDTAEGI